MSSYQYPPREFIEHIFWVDQVDWKHYNVGRAGVIPYVIINGHIYFCLGVDRRSQEFTDFGGGVSFYVDRDPVATALREFKEESKEVFGPENYAPENYLQSLCLLRKFNCRGKVEYRTEHQHMLIIFQEVSPLYLATACSDFQARVRPHKDEVSEIVWITEAQLQGLIYAPTKTRLYEKVRKFITHSVSFNRLSYFLKLRPSLYYSKRTLPKPVLHQAKEGDPNEQWRKEKITPEEEWHEVKSPSFRCKRRSRRIRFNYQGANGAGMNSPPHPFLQI